MSEAIEPTPDIQNQSELALQTQLPEIGVAEAATPEQGAIIEKIEHELLENPNLVTKTLNYYISMSAEAIRHLSPLLEFAKDTPDKLRILSLFFVANQSGAMARIELEEETEKLIDENLAHRELVKATKNDKSELAINRVRMSRLKIICGLIQKHRETQESDGNAA